MRSFCAILFLFYLCGVYYFDRTVWNVRGSSLQLLLQTVPVDFMYPAKREYGYFPSQYK